METCQTSPPLNILVLQGPELVQAGIGTSEFYQALQEIPQCRVLPLDLSQPLANQQEQVRRFLGQDLVPQPVLMVGQDPERRGAAIAQLVREEIKLNPEQLLAVDLSPALVHPETELRPRKCLELIRQASQVAKLAHPVATQTIKVNRRVLVWGDSWAGLELAWQLAESGYPVLWAGPREQLQPLSWEAPAAARAKLEERWQQLANHPLIQIIPAARLTSCQGVVGNFIVKLETPDLCRQEQVGAIVLAPDLEVQDRPQIYGFPEDPRVMALTAWEGTVAAGEIPSGQTVAIILGLAGESHPLALERALQGARSLLTAGNQVYLLVGNTKVAGPELQRLLLEEQNTGLVLIKLNEAPRLECQEDRLLLTFLEPSIRAELTLAVNQIIYDEHYLPASDNPELAATLRLPLGEAGFLQLGNVHYTPVATTRRGIFVAGPARGVLSPTAIGEDVLAVLQEVNELLGTGETVVPQGRAVVDRGKCVFCLTCYRFCPHGAITWDNRAIINEAACQGCGICASQCPQDAIQLRNYTDDQIEAQLAALDPQFGPRLVAFMCRNSAWEAYQNAVKLHAAALPWGFTPIKVPCAGKVDPDYLLKAFAQGAAGVLVLSCPRENCKSHQGNICAQYAVDQAQVYLAEAGLEPERLRCQAVAANAPADLIEAVDALQATIRRLQAPVEPEYPVWVTPGLSYREHRVVPPAYPFRLTVPPQPDLVIALSPADAARLGIRSGELFQTATAQGALTATALISPELRPGTAYLPRRFWETAIGLLFPDPAAAAQVSSEGFAVRLEKLTEQLAEIFGIRVPTSRFFHRGHTWLRVEAGGRVRLGMDDFSQKVFGASDTFRLPPVGELLYRDKAALSLQRQEQRAGVLAPLTGVVEEVNRYVVREPMVVHEDPYGEGWMMVLAPMNLPAEEANLIPGEEGPAWMEAETSRLLAMLDPAIGATLQAGGALVDDVYGQCPELGWDRLVKEFLHSV